MRSLLLISIAVGVLSSCQSIEGCLLAPCDSAGETPNLPVTLEQGQADIPDPIAIKATTEFYPNVPLEISLTTSPERNETRIFARSCNSQGWSFEGLESLNFKIAGPATLKACTEQLRMDTDSAISGMAPEFKSFQIKDGHLTLKGQNQKILIKAKLVGDEK